jgi:hypothetical protein
MTHATLTAETLGVVGLYVMFTAPFLLLLLFVHRLRSSYTGLFMAAIVLQLIPIGLIFFPLGFMGVGLLAYTLVSTARRNQAFRASGLQNPAVLRRWTFEYIANLWAFGFAIEQKGAALVFIQVTSRAGLSGLWQGFLPASVLVWLLLGPMLWRAHRALGTPVETPNAL